MDEITFIHGIGNGVLRKEIHKYLSHLGNIKYFQDTQKSRFGYGATLVRIS
jgi:dsDNA-specific endonuclease/ATPase MutS2